MLRVLLFLAGALASTFEDAQRLPFKGYCAKAPQAQQSGFPEAPPAHILQEAKLQLSGIQLVFRHGARDLSSDKPCFKPMRQAFKNCSIQTLVSFTGLSPSKPLPLVREVLDAYPLREVHLPGSGYISGLSGCGLGVLLDAAIPQTKALAAELRRYFPRLPAVPSRNTTRLYSTGKLRTEATLFLMQRELFGDSPGVRLFSRPVTSDPWDLNQHCPRAGLARHARHYKSGPNLITQRFPNLRCYPSAAARILLAHLCPSMAQTHQDAPVTERGRLSEPCVFFNSNVGCPYGSQCKFCHHEFPLYHGARPRKDRRAKIKERIWDHFVARNFEDMIEGLQQEVRQHPYACDLLKGYLERVRPTQAADGGIVFSL